MTAPEYDTPLRYFALIFIGMVAAAGVLLVFNVAFGLGLAMGVIG